MAVTRIEGVESSKGVHPVSSLSSEDMAGLRTSTSQYLLHTRGSHHS